MRRVYNGLRAKSKENFFLFLSLLGSDKNRKRNFKSQIKQEKIKSTQLLSLLQLNLLVEIILYSRQERKLVDRPMSLFRANKSFDHITTIV